MVQWLIIFTRSKGKPEKLHGVEGGCKRGERGDLILDISCVNVISTRSVC